MIYNNIYHRQKKIYDKKIDNNKELRIPISTDRFMNYGLVASTLGGNKGKPVFTTWPHL